MNWFISRLTEPSSYGGLASATYGVSQMAQGNIGLPSIAATLFGLAAFVMPEAAPAFGAIESAIAPASTANSSDAGSGK